MIKITEKQENKVFNFFRVKYGLILTSYDIEDIVKEISEVDKEFIDKLNTKIDRFRLITIVTILLGITSLEDWQAYIILGAYGILNVIEYLSSIYQSKHNRGRMEQ